MQKHGILIASILLLVAALPIVMIAKARTVKSDTPRIHLVLDMDNQARFKSQQANPIFADGRAMRPPVAGTVARGKNFVDEHLHAGKVNGEWATTFPLEVTEVLIRRGQERYEIFCAPCHGLNGEGNGMISQRAERLMEGTWTPPLSYYETTVMDRPHGHIFNSISNGIRNMPAYADQIPVEDRWAIVAYVRALQRHHNATVNDVPPEQLEVLTAQAQEALMRQQQQEQAQQ